MARSISCWRRRARPIRRSTCRSIRAGGISSSNGEDRWAAIANTTHWRDARSARARGVRPRDRQRVARRRRRAALALSRCGDRHKHRPLRRAGAREPCDVRARRILVEPGRSAARRCRRAASNCRWSSSARVSRSRTTIRWSGSKAAPTCCAVSARSSPKRRTFSARNDYAAPGRSVRSASRLRRRTARSPRRRSSLSSCTSSDRSGRRG